MPNRVTQCPKCHTSFRVTDVQLDIANGAVRCGSCLQIFNASDYWLSEELLVPKLATQTKASIDDSFDTPLDDDNFLIDDDIENTRYEDKAIAGRDFSDNSTLIAEVGFKQHSHCSEELNISENGTIADNEDHFKDPSNQDFATELSDSFLELDSWEDSPIAKSSDSDNSGDDGYHHSDAWAEELLAEDQGARNIDDNDAAATEFELHPELLKITPSEPVIDDELAALLSEAPAQAYGINPQPSATEISAIDDSPFNSANANNDENSFNAGERIGEPVTAAQPLFNNIEPEPVEMVRPEEIGRIRHWFWRVAVFSALLALPAQYVYYQFDTLSRDSQWRPWFNTSCQFLGCTLPELHDIGLIRSSNLIVRSHPKASNALVVDAMLTNRADFKQAFPVMALQFSDIHGQIVSGRRFMPNEYIAGELTGSRLMPSKQPIHISLAIIDPGSAAVNYQLHLLPQP